MAADHGPSIKDDEQYEGLRKKGMSKARAARIANSPGAEKRGGKKSGRKRKSSKKGGAAKRGGAKKRAGGRKSAAKVRAGRKGGKKRARKK